ncbi:MAG: ThiF family adenylyltransferase [Bacilli bacterium]|nr:ThiF family adenylyltransferase [Bacilli bacterium]
MPTCVSAGFITLTFARHFFWRNIYVNRLITLIGEDKFKKIEEIKVLIVGLGGVGGYALEAILRSGIKNIFIVDNDIIHISNLNRQIITSIDNIGKSKAEIAADRALSINPLINLTALSLFLDKENIDQIINEDFNYVIDACDSVNTKLLLIEYSLKLNYKLISCMGTANKTNPALFTITELTKTSNDPLARILRKRIKN